MRTESFPIILDYFLSNGVRGTSVQKLAAHLGISTKTFYKNFTNKESLLKETLHYLYNTTRVRIEKQLPAASSIELLCDLSHHALTEESKVRQKFCREAGYYYPRLNRPILQNGIEMFSLLFAKIIRSGIEDGVFRKSINVEVTLKGMSFLYTAISDETKFRTVKYSPDEIVLNSMLVYIRGMCTNKGLIKLAYYVHSVPIKTGNEEQLKAIHFN